MSDKIIRASAAGGAVRIFVADTREMVNEAFNKHKTYPVVTAALGRLLTAGAMMGVMQKSESDVLTLKIEGGGPIGKVIVTADSKGRVKGFAVNREVDIPLKPNGKLDVSGAIGVGVLTVIKDMGLKEPYVGTTELISGEIAEDLTYYFTSSEQVPSSVGLGVLVDKDYSVKRAGGFIVQLMPFAEESVISAIENNLAEITSVTSLLDEGKSPEDILNILMKGLNPEILDEIVPEYYCDCSREKVEKVLYSLGKKELQSIIDDGKTIEIHCDFCNTYYHYTVDEVKQIKASGSTSNN